MNSCDALIIGGGIGGLVCAGLLARRGMRVLLLEKEEKVGGYATGFMRQGFYFDAACAFVSACSPGQELKSILDELGCGDALSFLPITGIWNIYPGFDLRTGYSSPAAYMQVVKNRFPDFGQALDAYSGLTVRLGREFFDFEKAPWWKKALLPLFYPTLLRCARKSHADILRKFFGGNKDIELCLSALPTTLPPGRLSYTFVAVLWAKVLAGGVWYPKGGMQALTDMLVQAIRKNGGEIVCGRQVTRILTCGGKAVGIGLADGTDIKAPWVIGTINPYQGQRLLPEGLQLYGGMHRLAKYRPSLSALIFYAALPAASLPPDWPYFVSINTGRDLEAMAAALECGSMESGLHIVLTTPSLLDPSLAPSGYHGMKIIVHAPRADLFEQHYGTEAAMAELEALVFAAIRTHTGLDVPASALFFERATPATLLMRTGNEGGAMYGFDAACNQVGPLRPPNRTALANLLWIGHYTSPAHGIVGSALSGSFAARIVMASCGK